MLIGVLVKHLPSLLLLTKDSMLEFQVRMSSVEHSHTDMQLYSIKKEINLMSQCQLLFLTHKSSVSKSAILTSLSMQYLDTSMVMLSLILILLQFGKPSLVILPMVPKLL